MTMHGVIRFVTVMNNLVLGLFVGRGFPCVDLVTMIIIIRCLYVCKY